MENRINEIIERIKQFEERKIKIDIKIEHLQTILCNYIILHNIQNNKEKFYSKLNQC